MRKLFLAFLLSRMIRVYFAYKQCLQVADSAEGGQRHAVLHDFCMIIPHSSLIILAGLISMPFGAGWRGAILASTGAVELAVSIKSLQEFQAEKKSTPYTAASAGELRGSTL